MKFKSSLEEQFWKETKFEYEPDKLSYTVNHHYIPDFRGADGIYYEVKGWLRASDRQKLLNVKRCNPGSRIRMAFGNAENRLSKRSKTTYGQWATKHGFEWCDLRAGVPLEWKLNTLSKARKGRSRSKEN
jgi:hypothetical protein